MNNSAGKYYVKDTANGTFQDITSRFDGVAVLKADGMLNSGKPVNIYTEQWVNSQQEDFMITTSVNGTPVVIRENTDIELTFIVMKKYATTQQGFDVLDTHDRFVRFMTGGDIWLKSSYVGNRYVHCVCLSEYKPTTTNLQRGDASYIIGTIKLHALDAPMIEVSVS